MNTQIGVNAPRKEAYDKVTGTAKYTSDLNSTPMLHAHLLSSHHAHAELTLVNTSEAKAIPGVKKIITGDDIDFLCGEIIKDRPPLAKNKVRYFGEPIAMIISENEQIAKAAADAIIIEYSSLPAVMSIHDAIKPGATLVHKNLESYQKQVPDVYPEPNSNIFHHVKVRKGDSQKNWPTCDTIIQDKFKMPQSAHAAMETRSVKCQIMPSGQIVITAATQAPFSVRETISKQFNIPEGNVIVKAPLVGGGFGGKATVQLETLAVIASKAVDGKCVSLVNTREQDFITSPCHHGLEAEIKLGAKSSGEIVCAQMNFHVNSGAYCDVSPRIAKAIAADCSGPYNIPNIHCDCFAVYTNLPYATSFRGFGHISIAFCIERMIDKLANKLGIDPIEIRLINALKDGDLTPTGDKMNFSNTGDLEKCLNKLKTLISPTKNLFERLKNKINKTTIRATGIACLYKTSSTPTNAAASAILSFNSDGSINLDCGAVEIGAGMRTMIPQILAEKMKMNSSRIHIKMDIDTKTTPYYWKTVASMTTYMVGQAVLNAADDAIAQLLNLGSTILRCSKESLDFAYEKVFLKSDTCVSIPFKDIVMGYKYPNENAIGGPIIGRGNFIMNHLTLLDKETGQGKTGRSWTVGVQAVEIEFDKCTCEYKILKAITVIDAGKVIHPMLSKGVVMGGMCMGLGLGASEAFLIKENGTIGTTSFRTYKSLRYGEEPEYIVEFVETPQADAPFGARGIAEHGIIGIPAALANAVSKAAEIEANEIPVTPEYIWKRRNKNDSV